MEEDKKYENLLKKLSNINTVIFVGFVCFVLCYALQLLVTYVNLQLIRQKSVVLFN